MMRAAAINSIGGYADRYPHAEDHDLFSGGYYKQAALTMSPEILLKYRFHSEKVSVQNLSHQETSAARAERDNVEAERRRLGKPSLRPCG